VLGRRFSNLRFTRGTVVPENLAFTPEAGYGLSGTPIDGYTLTLSGAGFGVKPNGGPPCYWFDYGHDGVLTPSPLCRTGAAWTAAGHVSKGTLDAGTHAVNSTHSLVKNLLAADGTNGGNCGPSNITLPSASDCTRTFLWVKKRYDFWADWVASLNAHPTHPKDWNHKLSMLDAPAGEMGSDTYEPLYFSDQYDPIVRYGYHHFACVTQTTNYYDQGPMTALFGQYRGDYPLHGETDPYLYRCPSMLWYVSEQATRASDLDTANGEGYRWDAGWLVSQLLNQITRSTAYPRIQRSAVFDWVVNVACPAGTEANVCYDSVYFDDSWCRLYVADFAAWPVGLAAGAMGTVTQYLREIQIPVSWTDTEIQFVLRQGAHATLTGKTLWVVTNAGDGGTPVKVGTFT
jgi:hypothetical protein